MGLYSVHINMAVHHLLPIKRRIIIDILQSTTYPYDATFFNGPMTVDNVTYKAQDVVAQRLRIHLRTWYQEWFFDTSYGVDYLGKILRKGVSKTTVDNTLREHILSEPGVIQLLSFTSTLDANTRLYSCSFTVLSKEGSAAVVVNL